MRSPTNKPSMIRTQEMNLGQDEGTLKEALSHGRQVQPEDANADFASLSGSDLILYFQNADQRVPAFITDDPNPIVVSADYNVLANQQYLREAAGIAAMLGVNDQKGYSLVADGSDPTQLNLGSTGIANPNLLVGIQIEWSIPKLSAQAFDMRMKLDGWRNFCGAVVDRDVTVKLAASQDASDVGGIIQIPFAYRVDASQHLGYQYLGQGGMQVAICSPAYTPPLATGGGLIDTSWLNNVIACPQVRIYVPSNVRTVLNVIARPISAASLALASLREQLNF